MSAIELDLTSYFVDDVPVEENVFIDEFIKKVKELFVKKDVTEITSVDYSDYRLELTSTSSYKELIKLRDRVKDVLDTYPEYDITSNKDGLTLEGVDDDGSVIVIFSVNAYDKEKSNVDTTTDSSDTTNDTDEIKTKSIPILTNKAYNSFIEICNTTEEFLKDYKEFGKLRSFMLTKTNINTIAKTLFAPIKAWDYIGAECKMKKEEFDLLKSNLVQFSDDNACVNLGDYTWIQIFDWIKSRKVYSTKFIVNGNSFVAKVKTTVIDAKTKQKLGSIIVTLSIIVNENRQLADKRGNLTCYDSNISIDMIAR